MALTPEQDKRFKEELEAKKQQEALRNSDIDKEGTIKQEVKPDIVLECRLTPEGQMSWTIPQDMRMASYLLKILETNISTMFIARISQGIKPKPSIMDRLRVFK